jgi:hypothetical protein
MAFCGTPSSNWLLWLLLWLLLLLGLLLGPPC